MVLLIIAAAAILGGVVAAAAGRAGEMAACPADFPPLDDTDMSAARVFGLRPPMSIWGYHPGAIDETLTAVSRSMRAREAEIAVLRQELASLRAHPRQADAQPAGTTAPSVDHHGLAGRPPGGA